MDRAFRARIERTFGDLLTGPVRQRHDETEMRIRPGDVPAVMRTLHDDPALRFEYLGERYAGRATISRKLQRIGARGNISERLRTFPGECDRIRASDREPVGNWL